MKTIKQSALLLSIVAITVSTTLVLALALTDDVVITMTKGDGQQVMLVDNR
ncbi:hypothetical protein GT360_06025 [Vibrio astriarenae]|uniref:Uncharacterized protein n=1 Tax=Vibrio astriarenae TaxID=1481923 RepID=A0A7Z2YDK6_9VIBR|nr:hypothetical protein [Vibrio astriarenae]QIA63095.1 hypothetical protein GT360_06025 [Vibrio astriarenae]